MNYYNPLSQRERSVLEYIPLTKRQGIETALQYMPPNTRAITIESLLNPSNWNQPSTCYNAMDGD